MTRRFKLAIALIGGLASMPALTGTAFAVDPVQQRATQNALQDAAELRALRSQMQRQQYQQQQQFNREIDRDRIVPQQPRQPSVPVVRQNCRQSSGRVSTCR
ncbi:hypothetical protein [Manganibacter manganicus]|nr:hypothetical protein [Pseudaminobacter manganicus]